MAGDGLNSKPAALGTLGAEGGAVKSDHVEVHALRLNRIATKLAGHTAR